MQYVEIVVLSFRNPTISTVYMICWQFCDDHTTLKMIKKDIKLTPSLRTQEAQMKLQQGIHKGSLMCTSTTDWPATFGPKSYVRLGLVRLGWVKFSYG